jgi:DNA-binding NarL/FixJ family response regulator
VVAEATIGAMPDPVPAPTLDGRLRVLVVDADDRVRESLTGLVAIGGRVVVVGSAGSSPDALTVAAATRPDLILLDPRLPDVAAGTDLVTRLRDLVPGARILAMSWSDTQEHGGIDCGADGSIRKTFRPSELQAAIAAACNPVEA